MVKEVISPKEKEEATLIADPIIEKQAPLVVEKTTEGPVTNSQRSEIQLVRLCF